MLPEKSNSDILLYQSDDGQLKIQVRLENETVWLTQTDMVELFQSSKSNISEHIKHIFEEGEFLLQPRKEYHLYYKILPLDFRDIQRQ